MTSDDAKAADYYRAGRQSKVPAHVPARVLVTREVFGDGPFRGAGVAPGAMDCVCNRYGAVSVVDRGGKLLGLRLDEFEVLEWRDNVERDDETLDLFGQGDPT